MNFDFDSSFKLTDLKSFVVEWNNKYPLDYWWRKKFNVPFGSAQHREMSLVDMRIEYEEDQLVGKIRKKEEGEETEGLFEEEGKTIIRMSDKEIEKEFEDLDIDKFKKDKKDGD